MTSDQRAQIVEALETLSIAADTIEGLAGLLLEAVEAPDRFHSEARAIGEVAREARRAAKQYRGVAKRAHSAIALR